MRKLALRSLAFLGAVAACGDDGPAKKMDAGTGDDSQEIDAPVVTGNVKITITSGTTPMVGVRVHFQNANSTLVASVDTDANGVASTTMASGGYVTAVDPWANAPGGIIAHLITYAGVQAGDEILLKDDVGGQVDLVDFTTPADSTAGVTGYLVSTVCDNNTDTGTTITLGLYYKCRPTAEVIVASTDANGDIVNFAYATAVNTSGTTVDLSGQTLAAATSKTFTYNNVPASGAGVDLIHQLFNTNGAIIERSLSDLGTTVTFTPKLTPFTGALESSFAITGAPEGFHGIIDWAAFSANAYTVDVGARLLREATTGASFGLASHEVTWTEGSTGVVPDFTQVTTQTTRASNGLSLTWDMVAPYTMGTVKYPTVPVETVDYNSQSGDTVVIDTLTLVKAPGGYDSVREVIYGIAGPEAFAAAGSVTLQEIYDANALMLAPMMRLASPVMPRKRIGLSAAWKSRARL